LLDSGGKNTRRKAGAKKGGYNLFEEGGSPRKRKRFSIFLNEGGRRGSLIISPSPHETTWGGNVRSSSKSSEKKGGKRLFSARKLGGEKA